MFDMNEVVEVVDAVDTNEALQVAKAELGLALSSKGHIAVKVEKLVTQFLLEKLVNYAVRKSTVDVDDYVRLTEEYATFDEDVLEACNLKYLHIYREDEYSLRIVFEFTNELLSTAESLGFHTSFQADCTNEDDCYTDVVALLNTNSHILISIEALVRTSAKEAKSATEQCEAYRAFNEKLQELVTKLYTQ